MPIQQAAYDETRKWFAILPALAFPVTFVINAPFGRFSTQKEGFLTVDGIKSWIFMELVAPITFAYTYWKAPLAPYASAHPNVTQITPQNVLALAFVTHYMNRSLVSPLRTPSRAKSHLIIPLCAAVWNLANGYIIGSYLSSPSGMSYLSSAFGGRRFWLGLGVWALGFAGNIIHDEILLNLRRKVKKPNDSSSNDDNNGKSKSKKEHYAIPHGLLFEWVTFPNYFCEWVEWVGFAIAASPTPSLFDFSTFTPPWLFVVAEVLVMFPRAWKGHQWYHKTFPDYPKDRHVVIPYVL